MAIAAVRLIVRPHRAAHLIALILVMAYGWVVGGDPSVQRAVTAAGIYLAARVAGLVPRAVHVLSTVATIVVTIDPLTALDVGASLSFGATLGIVMYAGRFTKNLTTRLSRKPGWAVRSVLALFGATLAAELALLPIGATVFSRVSVAGLVLNFVAIPAMAIVQVAGMVVVVSDVWWPAASAGAGRVASVAAAWLRSLATSARNRINSRYPSRRRANSFESTCDPASRAFSMPACSSSARVSRSSASSEVCLRIVVC
jgi:competence protein ComEC